MRFFFLLINEANKESLIHITYRCQIIHSYTTESCVFFFPYVFTFNKNGLINSPKIRKNGIFNRYLTVSDKLVVDDDTET